MNKTSHILLAAIALIAGCSRPGVQGDGVIKTEDRVIGDFTKIEVTGGYHLKWAPGKPALNISADQNLLPLIKTEVSGGTLRIDSTESMAPSKSITITLSGSSLGEAELTGGIHLTASRLSGDKLKLESEGAAEITVEGAVAKLEANLTGASKLNATSLQAQNATLSLIGASDADVSVSDALDVSITGAGKLSYAGNPKSISKNILGAGSIRQR